MSLKRILIIGDAGSGKSTLAQEVGASLGIPVTHLDLLRCDDTFELVDPVIYQRRHDAVLRQEQWIIEGIPRNPLDSPTAARRLRECDAVIFLDYSPFITLWRSWRRSSGRAAIRSAIPAGARYRFNAHSIRRTLVYYFTMRPEILGELRALQAQGKQVHIVRDSAQAKSALAVLTASSPL